MITAIMRDAIRSYRDVPKNLYHIQWKFRDEVRPRFGVMRGREFLMKDAYSFDLDEAGARISYYKMFVAYLRSFARMGLKAVPMRADTGPIGGDLSHEFIILAETGESGVFCDRVWLENEIPLTETVPDSELEAFFKHWTSLYAATDEVHDAANCAVPADQLVSARGIEVGQIFYFGTKYSAPMKANVTLPSGETIPLSMGSYGIGVSRLVGAIIEASHDEAGIIWPDSVAPFKVGADQSADQRRCSAARACDTLYAQLQKAGVDVLYDDRDVAAGVKFADADLIGLPYQVIIGPRECRQGMAELKLPPHGRAQRSAVRRYPRIA